MSALAVILFTSISARGETASYAFRDVILDNNSELTGSFSWTYDVGDFENGVGTFQTLAIPGSVYQLDVLGTTIELSSIEITLDLNVHDDGVDISLFLAQPLAPGQSAPLDLVRSKYAIGGNGFNEGVFVSGEIAPVTSNLPVPAAFLLFASGCGVVCRGGFRRRNSKTPTRQN